MAEPYLYLSVAENVLSAEDKERETGKYDYWRRSKRVIKATLSPLPLIPTTTQSYTRRYRTKG